MDVLQPDENEKELHFKVEVVKFYREKLSDSQLDVGLSAKTKSRRAKRHRST